MHIPAGPTPGIEATTALRRPRSRLRPRPRASAGGGAWVAVPQRNLQKAGPQTSAGWAASEARAGRALGRGWRDGLICIGGGAGGRGLRQPAAYLHTRRGHVVLTRPINGLGQGDRSLTESEGQETTVPGACVE